jgi:hypothetical protein
VHPFDVRRTFCNINIVNHSFVYVIDVFCNTNIY